MIADVLTTTAQRTETHSVTFILTDRHLITLRFRDLVPFQQFQTRATQTPEILASSEVALIGLLEAIIAHGGVVLRDLASDLERVSQIIFWDPSQEDKRVRDGLGLRTAISGIGHAGERSSRIQQSLLSVDRLLVFHGEYARPKEGSPLGMRLASMQRDTASLIENAEFLSGKSGFLLDATLGFINAEQNQIIKILSVATTIFLPPTLVGTIYGMNFDVMPELTWPFGYPIALAIMVLSSLLPYLYFKRKGWV
jgi:magnesium transporter